MKYTVENVMCFSRTNFISARSWIDFSLAFNHASRKTPVLLYTWYTVKVNISLADLVIIYKTSAKVHLI